jgi:hypothetical protein
MQAVTVKLNLERGACRISGPLYLGSDLAVRFSEDGDWKLAVTEPVADRPLEGAKVLAQSDGNTLSLRRQALREYFEEANALQPNVMMPVKLWVLDGNGRTVADGEAVIEYSPAYYIIDTADYPSAREVLLQATRAKDQAISAKSAAETAKQKAEKARDDAQESKTSAEEAAATSSSAREDAIIAKNAAQNAKYAAEEAASTVETALGKMTASARQVDGGVEVLLWNGQGNKPVPIFIPHGIDGVTGYVKCDEDGKYYCLKCKEVDGEKVLALEQVGVDEVATEGYVRAVNGSTPDETGNVVIPLDFLQLTGGTLTGPIVKSGGPTVISRDTDGGYAQIIGGSEDTTNAHLNLYGKNHSTESVRGTFTLAASNGTATSQLIGAPDGTLTWRGKAVTLAGDCLPRTGGTMTGGIKTDNVEFSISAVDNAKTVRISGGTGWETGGSFIARGEDHPSFPGEFVCRAVSGEKKVSLIGKPDGTLTWCGNNIVRSINGNFADSQGDVFIECLQLVDSSYSSETEFASAVIGSSIGENFVFQSGVLPKNNYTSGATVTFDFPFSDTNYIVICQCDGGSTSIRVAVTSRATTGFSFETSTSTSVGVMWFAFGYPKD